MCEHQKETEIYFLVSLPICHSICKMQVGTRPETVSITLSKRNQAGRNVVWKECPSTSPMRREGIQWASPQGWGILYRRQTVRRGQVMYEKGLRGLTQTFAGDIQDLMPEGGLQSSKGLFCLPTVGSRCRFYVCL